MNWENYDRLVHRLRTMPPEDFDYMSDYIGAPSCMACQCAILAGEDKSRAENSIASFLDVRVEDAYYLYHPHSYKHGGDSSQYHGTKGIQAALANLEYIAARYGCRPSTQVAPVRQAEAERLFLLACRESASQSITAEVE